MKGLEFALIPHGHSEGDAGMLFEGYNFGDIHDKYRKRAWLNFPHFSVLIRHPDIGLILYDTGPAMDAGTTRAQEGRNDSNPIYLEREDYIDGQLKKYGFRLEDIRAILISHGHWDHYGGLMFFTETPAADHVYFPRADFAAGLVATHVCAKGYSDMRYMREDFDVPGINYHLVDEDQELFPGIDIFLLGGHSPAVMGIILHCESGNYLFPSDTVNAQLNYGPPVVYPSFTYDTKGIAESAEKVRKLQKKYDAKIIFPHDPWQFPELKKIPEFYS